MTSAGTIQDGSEKSTFSRLSLVHAGMAVIVSAVMLFLFLSTRKYPYLILSASAFQFLLVQIFALRLSATPENQAKSTWIVIGSISFSALLIPFVLENGLVAGLSILAMVPLFVGATNQLGRLPSALFITFVASALTILIDLVFPWPALRLQVTGKILHIISATGVIVYLASMLFILYVQHRHRHPSGRLHINLATQYALVISGISAMVITLVSGVLITQIRETQINQVGKNFQTVAENFAKLTGSHLEQQMQKLQLLTQQVPIFKESLIQANTQYLGDRKSARRVLREKNLLWQGESKDNAFVMSYLNSPIIEALSRFRGHNSFHNDILLVDGHGGLVASLGRKPTQFYFFDQHWWQVSWNGGLGNIFIGDLLVDDRTKIPKLRIAVDIIDHSTNKVIGILSSTYLLRTLSEDLQRFLPKTIENISLIDKQGNIIASSNEEISSNRTWPHLRELSALFENPDSGWGLGKDHLNQAALIGYSSLSTEYNVISDPLHRLGWSIVVSGSRSSALSGVDNSTKLAMLVGMAAMALGVLVAIAASRVITRPIEDLTATASAMSEGDLGKRAKLAGPEELIALSMGFNRLTNQLHQVINDLKSQATQLAVAKSDAEVATKLKGEFLANMSHEIRTPLNAILGFANILESLLENDKTKEYAKTIKTSGADLLHLINDILDLSKIEAGRMKIKLQSTDLRKLFDELERIFSISAVEKNISLEMEVASDVPTWLMLDNIRLKQVLFNLIGNAVKCTTQGSVFCSAKVTAKEQPGKWELVIIVRDTGIGIDPAYYNNIFETFQQYSGAPSANIEGTGLGLAISKNLVEMMGGKILVTGALGVGATFSIVIPEVSTADYTESEENYVLQRTSSQKLLRIKPASILTVDDLEVNQHLIFESLKGHPLRISAAKSGEEAIRLVKETQYDLILLDIRMPGMDGFSALKAIKAYPLATKTPVVAITASAMLEEIKKIKNAGFSAYLTRPFNQNELVELLAEFLPHTYSDHMETENRSAFPSLFTPHKIEKWTCTPEAEKFILNTLNVQWKKVAEQQSIPEILDFAKNVAQAGEKYHVPELSKYGDDLMKCADAFDIESVDILLEIYNDIMANRIHRESR